MKPSFHCPWCDAKIGFPARLGARPSARPPKWYQLSRTVAVCPYCSNPVRPDARSQLWLLLAAPLLALFVVQAFVLSWYSIPEYLFWISGGLAVTGTGLMIRNARMEKGDDI
jgi:hypothetical protein